MAGIQGNWEPSSESDTESQDFVEVISVEEHHPAPFHNVRVFRLPLARCFPHTFINPPRGGDNLCGFRCIEWICQAGVGQGQWTCQSIAEALHIPYQQPGFRGMSNHHLHTFAEQHMREISVIEYWSDGTPSDVHDQPRHEILCRLIQRTNAGSTSRWGFVLANRSHWWAFKHQQGDSEEIVSMNQSEIAQLF